MSIEHSIWERGGSKPSRAVVGEWSRKIWLKHGWADDYDEDTDDFVENGNFLIDGQAR